MTTTTRLGKKTLTITVANDKVSAVDARGNVYLADGKPASDGCADVNLYRFGVELVGRLIVDKDRAYFA